MNLCIHVTEGWEVLCASSVQHARIDWLVSKWWACFRVLMEFCALGGGVKLDTKMM